MASFYSWSILMRYLYGATVAIAMWAAQAAAAPNSPPYAECSGVPAHSEDRGGPGDACQLVGGSIGICDNMGVCKQPEVPEMSDYLAAAFIAAAGGMVYYIRRRNQKTST
jgi:hypothetical protein